LDNDEFFKRKFVFHDENENWFDDNGLRSVFFCKGALETVKKFGWPPDIIHCSGWMSALIPLYIKTAYKKDPVFTNSKVLYSVGGQTFEENFSKDFIRQAAINTNVKSKDLEVFKTADNMGMNRGGATFADGIIFASDNVDKQLTTEFAKAKGKKILPFKGWETDLTEYLELYNEIAP
jgi:starch synthase